MCNSLQDLTGTILTLLQPSVLVLPIQPMFRKSVRFKMKERVSNSESYEGGQRRRSGRVIKDDEKEFSSFPGSTAALEGILLARKPIGNAG